MICICAIIIVNKDHTPKVINTYIIWREKTLSKSDTSFLKEYWLCLLVIMIFMNRSINSWKIVISLSVEIMNTIYLSLSYYSELH